jgi:hypothetical protein
MTQEINDATGQVTKLAPYVFKFVQETFIGVFIAFLVTFGQVLTTTTWEEVLTFEDLKVVLITGLAGAGRAAWVVLWNTVIRNVIPKIIAIYADDE